MNYEDPQLEKILRDTATSVRPRPEALRNSLENMPRRRSHLWMVLFFPVLLMLVLVLRPKIASDVALEEGEAATYEELAAIDDDIMADLDILDEESTMDSIVGVLSLSMFVGFSTRAATGRSSYR